MNLHDLCPRGIELFAEYRKWEELWADGKLPQLRRLVTVAWQKFRDHFEDCDLCQEE